MSFSQTTPALGTRYPPHIEEICRGIANSALFRPLYATLFALVTLRLRRFAARLRSLAEHWQSGTLRPPRKRTRAPRKPPAAPPIRTPRGHAWLIRLHQPLAQFAPRIQLILDDPEIQALCEAAPQTGRLLRPLCRMFGLPVPPQLALPPRPRKPRPAKPRKPAPPPFAEHSPAQWPYVPTRLRLKVPGLHRRRSKKAALF